MKQNTSPEPDPLGRLDIAAVRLLEAYVQRQANPELSAWFNAARPVLSEISELYLGPIDIMPLIERAQQLQAVAPIRKVIGGHRQGGQR